ncbi:Major facilitator superfamily MFS_1 [uncultured Paludibacter sp.]|uniref:Major facilitator superfamily MFS_1 n=1 Tax=uncultured Paludibacter sp. TaxID=497635 RepID=A0A653AKV6_9BACT|nr:Major facilitator superfamily MFS_1 [uncultured Paludibacter sp.]
MVKSKWFHLFLSNFLGVFNDNFLKNSIIFIAIGWILPQWMTSSQLISIVSACLVIPYLFFSPIGGKLAMRFSKKSVFRTMKLIEIPIMMLACVSFYFQQVYLAVFAMLLMGTQSCLYSPSKYGLIRDIGGEKGASYGSGMFETMAFLGILLGTFFASLVSDHYSLILLATVLIGVAILGYIVTRTIKVKELPVENTSNTINPIKFVLSNYRFSENFKLINSAVFGASAFWLIGSMLQMNVIIHCRNVLHVSNSLTGVVMASAAVGIALGTAFTGKISKGEVKKGLIILSLSGMIVCLALMLILPLSFGLFLSIVVIFAFLGGMFQVPNLAIIQQANLGRKIGDVIAYLNMVTFLFILISTLLFSITTMLTNENSFAVFGVMMLVCLGVLLYFLFRYPEFREETSKMFK